MEDKQNHKNLWLDLPNLILAAGYFQSGYNPFVTFELSFKKIPPKFTYLIAAGIQQSLDYIIKCTLDNTQLGFIRDLSAMKNIHPDYFDFLLDYSFSGEVYSVAEGEMIFPNEPVIQIKAPLLETIFLETYLTNTISFCTMAASRSRRLVDSVRYDGKRRDVLEFINMGDQQKEAHSLTTYSSFIGGFTGTTDIFSGSYFKIPVFTGPSKNFNVSRLNADYNSSDSHKLFPGRINLLFNDINEIEKLNEVLKDIPNLGSIWIEGNNFLDLISRMRFMLDDSGNENADIVLKGNFDEYEIIDLIKKYPKIDIIAMGNLLSGSSSSLSLNSSFDLVEIRKNEVDKPVCSDLSDNNSIPFQKQIYRFFNEKHYWDYDVVTPYNNDPLLEGRNLIRKRISKGILIKSNAYLEKVREYAEDNVEHLHPSQRKIPAQIPYTVHISEDIIRKKEELKKQ